MDASAGTRPTESRLNAAELAAFHTPTWLVACALLLAAVIWFIGLGARSLVTPDEGRYATLALEMARDGDWVTPHLNGLLYFEKPAMQYWIGAASFLLFGVSEFTARLWPAVAGLLTALLTGFTAARLWGRESGIQAAAVVASMTLVFGNSHYLTLDAGLTFFLTVVLCAFLLGIQATRTREARMWIAVAWLAMAGAVLSKGLVGILIPGAVLVIVSVWRRRFRLWGEVFWWPAVVIFAVAVVPWFWSVSARNPGFAWFFFVHEHFNRYLTQVHHREGRWWYYVPLLLGGMLPWTGALPWLRARIAPDSAEAPPGRSEGIVPGDTLVAWSVFVFLFFSVSDSKLPSYILPMFPALALLTVMRIRAASTAALQRHLIFPTFLWVLALAASTDVKRWVAASVPFEALAPMALAVRVGALVFVAGAALAWWLLGARRTTLAVLSVALAQIASVALLMHSYEAFGRMKSAAPIAEKVSPLIGPDTPIFAVQAYDQTLPFYFRRDVVLVDYHDEFSFGQTYQPTKSIASLDAFAQRWRALPQAMAYMTKDTWVTLQKQGLPMKLVFDDEARVAVMKP